MREPNRPMAEVRESDDGAPPDAKHLAQNLERLANLLEGLTQNHVFESFVRIIGKALIDVSLVHRDAARDRPLDPSTDNLHATRVDAFMLREPLKQLAIAAADVQDTRVRLNNIANDRVVAAAKDLTNEWAAPDFRWGRRHEAFAAFSRNVLARKPRMSSVCSATSTRKASCP